ncbi:hypothetical protein [Jatrophihabitans sp.]|uniref:hypothetical protein n=1 Tax=Jatrophihabitans sp. TaxID=1932789 RepID=UPI0030C6985B|nr:hypothetical protein [Jatrophihabitans sp.]
MGHIKPRTTSVVIYQGDDMPRLTELRRAAETARQFEEATAERLAETSEVARAGDDDAEELVAVKAETKARQDEYDAFVDEAAERALTIELHAIGRKRFRDLMAEHPPRKVLVKVEPAPDAEEDAVPTVVERDHEDDAGYDVNTETFPDALLTFIDPENPEVRTIAAPEFASRSAARAFLDDELEEGDFPGLWVAAYYLNRMPSADPFQSKYSAGHQTSTVT